MKRCGWYARILVAVSLSSAVADDHEQHASSSLAAFDRLTARWMGLRAEIAEETREWEEQRNHLEAEGRLLEKQQATLQEALQQVRQKRDAKRTRREDLVAQKRELQAVLESVRSSVTEAEDNLRGWKERIPEPLRATMGTGFDAVSRKPNPASASLAERLQTVLSLFSEIESLQNAVHSRADVLETPGGRPREMDVLYVGLARAFAVTRDDEWAAVGVPTAAGWQWRPAPAHAKGIRNAFEVFNRRNTARLVPLPMNCGEGAVP